jgi:hypothetical protein
MTTTDKAPERSDHVRAQLRGDLDLIESAVDRADMPEGARRVFRDVIEWQRGFVGHNAELAARVEELEVTVDGLLEGAEEGISVETAQVILTALEQARHVCAAVTAMVEGDKLSVDELTRKRFGDQVRACERSVATAVQAVGDIVFTEDDEDEDDDDEPSNGEGDEDDDSDEEDDDEPKPAAGAPSAVKEEK